MNTDGKRAARLGKAAWRSLFLCWLGVAAAASGHGQVVLPGEDDGAAAATPAGDAAAVLPAGDNAAAPAMPAGNNAAAATSAGADDAAASSTRGIRTQPADDAVLGAAPSQLSFEFPAAVRLVKLTLHRDSKHWVDIKFRYSPTQSRSVAWLLPQLEAASYYTASWAAVDGRGGLTRGQFSFAFGPDAVPPSTSRALSRGQSATWRGEDGAIYVMPPPTRFIIDQDPPKYDPPFTIDLSQPPD